MSDPNKFSEAPEWLANFCVCDRVVDTREITEGGDSHGSGFDDGRWTCSFDCWAAVVDLEDSTIPNLLDALKALLAANDGVEKVLCDGPDVPGFDPMELGRAQERVTAAEKVARAAILKAEGR